MKIYARLKLTAESWFDTLTEEQKKAYVKEHPNSKYAKNYKPSVETPTMEKPAKTTKPASKTSDFNSYISKDSGFFEDIKNTMEWLGEDDGIDSITEDDLMDRLYENAMGRVEGAGYDYDDAISAAENWVKLKDKDSFIRSNLDNLKRYASGKPVGKINPFKSSEKPKSNVPEADPNNPKEFIKHPDNENFFDRLFWDLDGTEDMSDEEVMDRIYESAFSSMSNAGYDYYDVDSAVNNMLNLKKNDSFIRKNLPLLRKMASSYNS